MSANRKPGYKIIAHRWWTQGPPQPGVPQLGAVLELDEMMGTVQAYLGSVDASAHPKAALVRIAIWGAKLEPQVARAIWPEEAASLTFKQEVAA